MKYFKVAILFAVPLFVFSGFQDAAAWSLFGPDNYEECTVEAAKEAGTNNALRILLKDCKKRFPKKGKSRTNSAKSAPKDLRRFVSIQNWNIECVWTRDFTVLSPIPRGSYDPAYADEEPAPASKLCKTKTIFGTLVNNSKSAVSYVGLGLILSDGTQTCARNAPETTRIFVKIPARQSASFRFQVQNNGPDKPPISGCLVVTTAR